MAWPSERTHNNTAGSKSAPSARPRRLRPVSVAGLLGESPRRHPGGRRRNGYAARIPSGARSPRRGCCLWGQLRAVRGAHCGSAAGTPWASCRSRAETRLGCARTDNRDAAAMSDSTTVYPSLPAVARIVAPDTVYSANWMPPAMWPSISNTGASSRLARIAAPEKNWPSAFSACSAPVTSTERPQSPIPSSSGRRRSEHCTLRHAAAHAASIGRGLPP